LQLEGAACQVVDVAGGWLLSGVAKQKDAPIIARISSHNYHLSFLKRNPCPAFVAYLLNASNARLPKISYYRSLNQKT
jgi:hypothetical protein